MLSFFAAGRGNGMSGQVQLVDLAHVTNRMSRQLMQFGSCTTENGETPPPTHISVWFERDLQSIDSCMVQERNGAESP